MKENRIEKMAPPNQNVCNCNLAANILLKLFIIHKENHIFLFVF